MKRLDSYYEWLIDMDIATENELQLITDINGYSEETLNDVLFCRTGYHDYEQFEECN